jgi:hypothetical protein
MTARPASRLRRYRLGVVALLGALLTGLVCATGALAAEEVTMPHWKVEARAAPTNLPAEGNGAISVSAANIGDAEAKGPIHVADVLPVGITVTGVRPQLSDFGGTFRYTLEPSGFECAIKSSQVVECTMPKGLDPFETIYFLVKVKTTKPAAPAENTVEVHEGGSLAAVGEQRKKLSFGEPPPYGIEPAGLELTPENENFQPDLQSGDHPFQLTTTVNFNQTLAVDGPGKEELPSAPALSKNLTFQLPAGLIGRAAAVPQCTDAEFGVQEVNNRNSCPENTVVGVADVTVNDAHPNTDEFIALAVPVFNLEPGPGEPARFGFETFHVPVVLDTSVRTGGDYGATISLTNASDAVQLLGSRVTIWGTPADPRHDTARGWPCLGNESYDKGVEPPIKCGKQEQHNKNAFLTLPTSCGEQATKVTGEAWGGALLPEATDSFTLSGCQELDFSPSIEVKTDEHTASTPSGLTVEVSVPQEGTLTEGERAEADIRSTTLALPPELETSAGAANSLATCGVAQAGFNEGSGSLGTQLEEQSFSFVSSLAAREAGAEPHCPDASKIGTVEINTPFLSKPVTGSLYLASQDTNPFASPLVLYLIAEEPESKVLVKLAGEVEIMSNGQLVSRFKKTPQVAFEHLKLHLFNGSSSGAETAAQATPARCGATSATASFETWSEKEGEPFPKSSSPEGLAITAGPHGTACTQAGEKLPFALSFQAGSANAEAGKYSPFTLTIARPDGSQGLKGIDMELPPGLAAKLASVPLCGEPAAAEGTCSEESKIGESTTYSGLGNAPVNLPGKVYLTGPYDGAPFGLSTVTNAEHVGPFNIGRIVVRSTIKINETTAAANINTEATRVINEKAGTVENYPALPELIKGLPAQIKQLDVTVNRPEFEFNPTNCSTMPVTGTLAGYEGTNAGVSANFKATNCGALAFAPKLTASVVGQGSKTEGTTFAVKIEFPSSGQANIHKVDLTIPSKLPSRLTTIQKACLEAVFNANPASCDEGSVIGEGVVHTPVFKNPLRGPAYLVSHGGAAFPDVEFVLQGEGVKIVVDGKTFIHEGVTYSKFETSPDAPFSTFETVFPKGPHSALTPSVPESENFNLCKQTLTVPTEITGQNGAFISQTTKVAITGCKGVLGVKYTKAQLLAKALKACRTKYKAKSKKAKLQKCEKAARKKYGTPHKKSSKKHPSSKKK